MDTIFFKSAIFPILPHVRQSFGLSIRHVKYVSLGRDTSCLLQLACSLLPSNISLMFILFDSTQIYFSIPDDTTSKSLHAHDKVAVELERSRAQRFRQGISMLPCRPHVRNGDRSLNNQLPWELMAYIDVLRVGHGFCPSCTTPSLSSNAGTHDVPTPGNPKHQTCCRKSISFVASAIATYSASAMESVTQF